MRIWFQKKFRLPATSEEWLNSSLDELTIWFLEDLYLEHDDLARGVRLKHIGMEVAPTGDSLLDKWERQIAQGIMPDLDEDEDPRAAARDARIREAARKQIESGGDYLYIASLPEKIAMVEQIRDYYGDIEFDADQYKLASGYGDIVRERQPVNQSLSQKAVAAFIGQAGQKGDK